MIRVNLRKAITTKRSEVMAEGGVFYTPAQLQQLFLLRAILFLLFPLALYFYEGYNIPILRGQISKLNSDLSALRDFNGKREESVKEIKKFKEEEERVKSQIKALESISRFRSREIRFIDLVQQVIPVKAWFTKLIFMDGRVQVQGLAMSEYEVQTFADGLTRSAFITDVSITGSKEEIVENISLRKFEIACAMEKSNE